VDPLSQFLDGPRAVRAFTLGVSMTAPWGIDVRDGAALTLVALTRGEAVVEGLDADGRPATRTLAAGDVLLARGPAPYRIGDRAGGDPTVRIGPGQVCTTLDGEPVHVTLSRGLHRWGNADDGETQMLLATYERGGDIGRLATTALPPLAVVRRDAADPSQAALLTLLDTELGRDEVARSTVLDRLVDLLLVASTRAWLAAHPSERPASWLVRDDPVVTAALALLHDDPSEPWTVASLARRLAVSRATLAARFSAGVGTPPMRYLAEWRMSLASEQLADPAATVAAVGRRVGYESPFTFSVAFKRRYGVSPSAYRRTARLTG